MSYAYGSPLPDHDGPGIVAAARFGALRQRRRVLFALVMVALLGQMAVAMVTAAAAQTPTTVDATGKAPAPSGTWGD